MAAISDKITKTMDARNPTTTTVASQRSAGATELRAVSLDGWQQDTAMHFSTYRLDSQGELVEGSQTDWKGVVNLQANAIVNIKRMGGAEDAGNLVGDVIEALPTAAWANDLAEALLVHHDASGSLRPGTITAEHINFGSEYKLISNPDDLNTSKFLSPGKWRFGTDAQVTSTKNLPETGKTGFLETISHSGGETQPGANIDSTVLQVFTSLDGSMYIRKISSSSSASNITYGSWVAFSGKPKKHAKDSNNWIKRELPGGVIEYSIHHTQQNHQIGGSSWGYNISFPLPVGVTYDAEKMSFTGSVLPSDSAISLSCGIGSSSVSVYYANNYHQTVRTNVTLQAVLRVYPE